MANDGGYGDVEEEERGDELGDESSVERPLPELCHVEKRSWWRVNVVFAMVVGLSLFAHFFRHSLTFVSLSLSLEFGRIEWSCVITTVSLFKRK